MHTTLIQLFARPPLVGKVKTRLIPSIGAQNALAVYQYCLEFNRRLLRESPFDFQVWFSDPYDAPHSLYGTPRLQQGKHLGERMLHAMSSALAGGTGSYDRVILIGADCLDLSPAILQNVDQQLDQHELVIIPATDGGYVLIAAKSRIDALIFADIPWGTDKVLAQTLARAKQAGVDVCVLDPLKDIDRYEDLHHYAPLQRFL